MQSNPFDFYRSKASRRALSALQQRPSWKTLLHLLGGGGILQDSTIPTWHSSQCRLWLPERGKEMGTLL